MVAGILWYFPYLVKAETIDLENNNFVINFVCGTAVDSTVFSLKNETGS